jgi:hypothetical protein
MFKLLNNIFGKKSAEIVDNGKDSTNAVDTVPHPSYSAQELFASPFQAEANFLSLFANIPEVFFPIDYIASRISSAQFHLKRYKDDSIVWRNLTVNAILNRPNCMYDFRKLVYEHFVYKLATGNSYIKCAVPELLQTSKTPIYKNCSNYWVLPSDKVYIQPVAYPQVFNVAEREDVIAYYQFQWGWSFAERILPNLILHDREMNTEFNSLWYKGQSRMLSLMKPISNLIAVYEARNVIYIKRGGLGWIVSQKQDETGTRALEDNDIKSILRNNFQKYGVGAGQFPYGITDVPITFVRTNLSIAELQPFDETLQDAITIAAAYGIPAVLVPRKDQSTFSNQATAEKSVYSSVVIPMAKRFCERFTQQLGLDRDGLYIDADFVDVDCMQAGRKEQEDVMTEISARAMTEFTNGIITLNDYRSRIGEERIELPIFDKILYEMTPDELETVGKIVNKQYSEQLNPSNNETNDEAGSEQSGSGESSSADEDE